DPSIARALTLNDSRGGAGTTSSAQILETPSNRRLFMCAPGLSGGIGQPNMLALVTNWMQGVSASLDCSVTVNGNIVDRQTVAFAVASGQVTFGARSLSLSTARSAETITASDVFVQPFDALFGYTALYTDSSYLGFTRYANNPALAVTYLAASG